MKYLIYILSFISLPVFGQDYAIASGNKAYDGARDGYTFLKQNARCAWDFTRMTSKYLGSPQDTVLDFTGNGRNAFRSGTTFNPKQIQILSSGGNSITALLAKNENVTKQAYVQDGTATALFNQDFEIHVTFSLPDGQAVGAQYILGLNNGAARRVFLYVNTTGTLRFNLNLVGATISEWETTHAFNNNAIGPQYVRIRVDFTSDQIKAYVNGIETTFTLLSGDAISLINPATFSNTFGVAIGGNRTGSTSLQSADGDIVLYKAAITGLLTDIQSTKVANWMTFLK